MSNGEVRGPEITVGGFPRFFLEFDRKMLSKIHEKPSQKILVFLNQSNKKNSAK